MNKDTFKNRLIFILKIRTKVKRDELVNLLRTFWKYNKEKLEKEYQYYCYNILVKVLRTFDSVIINSRYNYYYVYRDVLVEVVKTA